MKKKKQDKPNHISFFCDRCGYKVSQDATNCPGCGRSFSSVKCPVCNFVGEASHFTNGCPVCGYSSNSEKPSIVKTQSTTVEQVAVNVQITQATYKPLLFTSLPLWIYIVTGLSLLIAVTALCLTLR
ncbi:MAG: hypothetical protein LBH75_01690 [Treponema sp.]|nr:hypothetical protein [Treponema sp.]